MDRVSLEESRISQGEILPDKVNSVLEKLSHCSLCSKWNHNDNNTKQYDCSPQHAGVVLGRLSGAHYDLHGTLTVAGHALYVNMQNDNYRNV